jgi:hypothetical protein
MAAYYGRAHRLRAKAQEVDAPALLNAVIAELVLSWWAPDAALGAAQRRSLDDRCATALAAVRAKNESDPDFWSGAGEIDAALTLALLAGGIDDPAEQVLVDGYRRALARGASPRERASLVEHLDFLIEMTTQPVADEPAKSRRARRAPAALPATLMRIRDAL